MLRTPSLTQMALALTWSSKSNTSYRVMVSTEPAAANPWSEIAGGILAVGPSTTYTNYTPTGDAEYYRVEQE